MKELVGKDLFEIGRYADALCITTNGVIDKSGLAVMGRGCALEAKQRWPGVPKALADKIKLYGNVPNFLGSVTPLGEFQPSAWNKTQDQIIGVEIWSFPTKQNWHDRSDLNLITASARSMVRHADERKLKIIVIPRPGCNNGQLNWKDVKRVLSPILDQRFIIVTNDSI